MVAFGLQQINIHSATYRPGTDEKEEWTDKWLSTPWSDIEVGMAFIMFVGILFTTLLGKVVGFISNIIIEINYRL